MREVDSRADKIVGETALAFALFGACVAAPWAYTLNAMRGRAARERESAARCFKSRDNGRSSPPESRFLARCGPVHRRRVVAPNSEGACVCAQVYPRSLRRRHFVVSSMCAGSRKHHGGFTFVGVIGVRAARGL